MESLISVIIPIYNVEKYLSHCIESVIKQTYTNFEIVCICEPCDDQSIEIIKQFQKQDNRIRIFYNTEKRGLSYNRNYGMKVSRGEYIYFLDSDDWIEESALETMCRAIKDNNAEIVTFSTKIHYEVNPQQLEKVQGKYQGEYLEDSEGVLTGLQLHDSSNIRCSACMYFFDKAFLVKNKISFLQGIIHEDVLFYFYILYYGTKIKVLKMSLHNYRRRAGSITDAVDIDYEKEINSYLHIFTDVLLFAQNKKQGDEEKKKLIGNFMNIGWRAARNWYDQIPESMLVEIENNLVAQYGSKLMDTLRDIDTVYYIPHNIVDKMLKGEVYVYGAGKVANRMLYSLELWKIQINGILVTDAEDNPVEIRQNRVFVFEKKQANFGDETIILLAVGDRIKDEIRAMIKENHPSLAILGIEEKVVTEE